MVMWFYISELLHSVMAPATIVKILRSCLSFYDFNSFLSYIKNCNSMKFYLLRGYCLLWKSPLRFLLVRNPGGES